MKEYQEIRFVESHNGYYFGSVESAFLHPENTLSMETVSTMILNKGLNSNWGLDMSPIVDGLVLEGSKVFVIRVMNPGTTLRITEDQMSGRKLLETLKNLRDVNHHYRKEKEKVYNNKGTFTLREGGGEDGSEVLVHVDYFGNGVMGISEVLDYDQRENFFKEQPLQLYYNSREGISSGLYISKWGTVIPGGWEVLNNFVMKDGIESMETELVPEQRTFSNLKTALYWLRDSKGLGEIIENYEKVLELDRQDEIRATANAARRKLEEAKQSERTASGQYSKEEVLEIIKMLRPDLDLESGLIKRLLG